MYTEVIEFIKKIMQKEFFWIDFANTALSLVVIVTGIIGLASPRHVFMHALTFAAGSILLLLNSYKGFKNGNKNRWVFLAGSFVSLCVGIAFLVMMLMS